MLQPDRYVISSKNTTDKYLRNVSDPENLMLARNWHDNVGWICSSVEAFDGQFTVKHYKASSSPPFKAFWFPVRWARSITQ